jgi:hypothetical protein
VISDSSAGPTSRPCSAAAVLHRLSTFPQQRISDEARTRLAVRHTPPAGGVPGLAKPPCWSIRFGCDQTWRQCGRVAIARMQQCRTIARGSRKPAGIGVYRHPALRPRLSSQGLAKPFSEPDENVLKQSSAYPFLTQGRDGQHAVHHEPDLGLLAQQFDGRPVAGEASMTMLVAFLVCCSAAVFLAHAFDAYSAD